MKYFSDAVFGVDQFGDIGHLFQKKKAKIQ